VLADGPPSIPECDRCGACCRTFPVYASARDAAREPRIATSALELKAWLGGEEWRFQLHPLPFLERCAFLDGRSLCAIYETRPEVCRKFAPGSTRCNEARARIGLAALETQSIAKVTAA
jgi:Fe-S-cluster containining protein